MEETREEQFVRIFQFDPLELEFPETVDGYLSGDITIYLPLVSCKLIELCKYSSGLLPHAAIYGGLDGWGITITCEEPISIAKFEGLIVHVLPSLEKVHAAIQARFDEWGALLHDVDFDVQ